MIDFFILFIRIAGQLLYILILAQVILSYFMSPYHPVRATIDKIVEPMLAPIRKILPSIAMIDFSPVVLLILVQLIQSLLISILTSLG